MTDEYKKILFDYVTSNIKKTEPNDKITTQYLEVPIRDYRGFYHGSGYSLFNGVIQSSTNNLVILYGMWTQSITDMQVLKDTSGGFIIICDKDLQPIKYIDSFSTGTKLRPIMKLIQLEDGTFFGVDTQYYFPNRNNWNQNMYATSNESQRRIIMLNNLTEKVGTDYQATLRRSYIFSADYQNFICKEIFKDPNSSHYCLLGYKARNSSTTSQTSWDYDSAREIELKINVGSANEWSKVDDDGTGWLYGGSYCHFEDDKANWVMLLARSKSSNRSIFKWNISSTTAIATLDYRPYIDYTFYEKQTVFTSANKVYFVINNQRWGNPGTKDKKYIALYEADLSTNTSKEIFNKYLGDYDFSNLEAIYLQECNGELYINYINNYDSTNYKADYYWQRFDGKWNPQPVDKLTYNCNAPTTQWFYTYQKYNLNRSIFFSDAFFEYGFNMTQMTQVYNLFNYNGESYIDEGSLIPHNGILYAGDRIAYARNLYNFTLNQNIATSTIEIPQNYLNTTTISKSNLLSKNNNIITSNDKTLTKNQYELVHLNFINSLNVVDMNGKSQLYQAILNQNASNHLNRNSNTRDNQDVRLTTYEVTNQDGSSYSNKLNFTKTDDTHGYYLINLIPKEGADKINIKSNDGTIYQSIDISQFEIGKLYELKQYIEVM